MKDDTRFTHCRCFLVLIFGLPGTGKTTLARKLSELFGCARVTTEDIRAHFFNEELVREDKDFSVQELRVTYSILLYLTDCILASGGSVIVDGVFRNKQQRKSAELLARKRKAKIVSIMTTCAPSTAKRRLLDRKHRGTVSPAGPKTYDSIKKHFAPPNDQVMIVSTDPDTSA